MDDRQIGGSGNIAVGYSRSLTYDALRFNQSEWELKLRWSRPRIAKGERIYAIGDIHGCLDLFVELLSQIEKDAQRRKSTKTKLVIIGDFIDRGSRSAEILKILYECTISHPNIIVLRGNHEQVMLQALSGDLISFEAWLRFGGDATLRSWGIDWEPSADPSALMREAISTIPSSIIRWLSFLPFTYRSADVLFVHAGVRPGIPLHKQSPDDLLWIGATFLNYRNEHPALIVHGHTISENGPNILPNRIGLDTGAYRTGRLSAVGFEGSESWIITT